MITCPHCNRKTHEGRHCEKCGGALDPASEASRCASDETPTTRGPADETSHLGDSTVHAKSAPYADFGGMWPSWTDRDLDDRIDEKMREFDEKIERATSGAETSSGPQSFSGGRVDLDFDRLGVLYEDIVGSVRFRLTCPPGMSLRNVTLKLTNRLLDVSLDSEELAQVKGEAVEFAVGFPAMKAGSYVWSVELAFECDRMRHVRKSSFELLVMRSDNSKAIAEQLVFNIHNDIRAEGAADVQVSNRIADELKGVLSRGEDPFRVLQKVVCGRDRAWCRLKLHDGAGRSVMPPCPPAAKTDSLKLNFGYRIVRLCANRTVSFGRNRDRDFVIRPAENCTEDDKTPYRAMSRRQCYFEHDGDRIFIHDGQRLNVSSTVPSTFGTFVDNRDIGKCGVASLADGARAVLSFGGIAYGNVVSLDAKATSPKFACAKCPYSDPQWCGRGRPSLVLSRRDGIPETFVCLWSCFNLGEIDRSFDGLVIFRKEGAFAWFRGADCGWLVPDAPMQTDYGTVTVTTGLEDKTQS